MHIVRGLEADFIYSFADAMRGMDCHTLACPELVEGFAMTAGSWKAQRGIQGSWRKPLNIRTMGA